MASSIPFPENKDLFGYELAFKLVCERLSGITDIAEQCRKSGAECQTSDSRKTITLEYLNRCFQITLPDIVIKAMDGKEELKLREQILLLHYFTQAKGTKLTSQIITYKELPGATNYIATFTARAIKPLVDNFGKKPERLLDMATTVGGKKADYGDVSVTITAFSRVPITLVLWRGDDEFPPSGNILFDNSITDYLTLDDINVLCETMAWKLVKQDKQR